MVNKSKKIGTAAESAFVKYCKQRGYQDAERIALAGFNDRGDVRINKRVMAEIKSGDRAEAASHKQIEIWLLDTIKEQLAGGWAYSVLITKRHGAGLSNVGEWWAWLNLNKVFTLFHETYPHDNAGPVVRLRVSDYFDLLDKSHFNDVVQT